MSYTQFENNIQTAVLGATFTSTSGTAWVDVTGLSLPVLANTSYEFEFDVIFQTSVLTRGLGLGVNGPASPTSVLVYTEIPSSTTAVTLSMARAYNTVGAKSGSVDIVNTNMYGRCYGHFSNGANVGNLILSLSGESGSGTPSYRVMANSIMRMWRVNPSN